jgi:carbon storage regulator
MVDTGHLILTRRPGESFTIGADIEVTIESIKGNQARVSIHAPKNMKILRSELERFPGDVGAER